MNEYEVVGTREFREHAPGERFSADLSAEEEARLIRRGAIKKVGAAVEPDPPEVTTEVEEVDTEEEPEEETTVPPQSGSRVGSFRTERGKE